jgi:hypothetical protein
VTDARERARQQAAGSRQQRQLLKGYYVTDETCGIVRLATDSGCWGMAENNPRGITNSCQLRPAGSCAIKLLVVSCCRPPPTKKTTDLHTRVAGTQTGTRSQTALCSGRALAT